jgi:hypothetical protein
MRCGREALYRERFGSNSQELEKLLILFAQHVDLRRAEVFVPTSYLKVASPQRRMRMVARCLLILRVMGPILVGTLRIMVGRRTRPGSGVGYSQVFCLLYQARVHMCSKVKSYLLFRTVCTITQEQIAMPNLAKVGATTK